MIKNQRWYPYLLGWYQPILLFGFILLLHGWSLMRYPTPWVDEAWFAARGWALIHTGKAFSSLDAGVADRFNGYWTFFPWLPAFFQSLNLRFFDTPSLLAVREVSLTAGLILLSSVYAIGYRAGGKFTALVSALTVAISYPFFESSHSARPDIFVAALGFIAIAIYTYDRGKRFWVSLASGLLVGLSFEIHANGAIYGPTIAALYIYGNKWQFLRNKGFWGFVCGVSIGLLFFTSMHILPYPQTYFTLMQIFFAPTHTPPLLTLNLSILTLSAKDIVRSLMTLNPLSLPLLLWSIVSLVKKNSGEDKLFFVIFISLIISEVFLIRNKNFYYAILLSPICNILLAILIYKFLKLPIRKPFEIYIRYVLIIVFLFAYSLHLKQLLYFNNGYTNESVCAHITEFINSEDKIMGSQTCWFSLYKHTYYSWEELVYYQRYNPGSNLRKAFEELHPDVFIIDSQVANFIVENPNSSSSPDPGRLILDKSEMEEFLKDHTKLLGGFFDGFYGDIRIYRILQ